MKARKLILGVLALVLVAALSVAGTLAYLTYTTGPVTNTFTSASLIDPPGDTEDPTYGFQLKEHKATDDDKDGVYALGTDEVTENTYVVYPGVDIPKDPFVRVHDLSEGATAYVFVEVVDGTSAALTVTVDDATWTATQLTGQNGGVVYKLAAGKISADLEATYILKDNTVVVAEDAEAGDDVTLSFYGYLLQASGFETAEDAWNAVYPGATTTEP